jgi:hypothetical protein
MKTGDPQKAVDYGAAHGALVLSSGVKHNWSARAECAG